MTTVPAIDAISPTRTRETMISMRVKPAFFLMLRSPAILSCKERRDRLVAAADRHLENPLIGRIGILLFRPRYELDVIVIDDLVGSIVGITLIARRFRRRVSIAHIVLEDGQEVRLRG